LLPYHILGIIACTEHSLTRSQQLLRVGSLAFPPAAKAEAYHQI
jgi:hypothetical protein